MLRRRKSALRPQPVSSHLMVTEVDEVEEKTTVTWSIDQLNSLGPVTGPGHRTFVPIVRSLSRDNGLRGPIDSMALESKHDGTQAIGGEL